MLPVCRKFPTTHGPHSTCLMTAESYLVHYRPRHSRWLQVSHCKCTLLSCHISALFYLSTHLLSSIAFVVLSLLFIVSYIGVRLFLRFQLKLAMYLILLQRVPFEFKILNQTFILCLNIMLVLIGGFGFLVISFIDM